MAKLHSLHKLHIANRQGLGASNKLENKNGDAKDFLITGITGSNEIYANKTFEYKIISFNKSIVDVNQVVSKVQWGYSVDEKNIITINQKSSISKNQIILRWKVPNITGNQVRVYAWLKSPIKDVSVISNLRIAPPIILFVNGYSNTRSDMANPGYLKEYWDDSKFEDYKNFSAQYFKTRLNQQFFINGADTMFSGASKRYSNGYNYAKNRLTNTQSNLWEELMTDKDKDNHFTRPVIVISHSMGGAFAEGMLSFFKKMKLNVEKVIHFSPADVSGFTVNFPEITYQIDINPDPVLKFKNLNDRPLIRNIKNASVAQNPLDDMYGHDYSKRKGFVWNWFEDLNELKFRPIRKVNLPSWGGLKEHQVYELIYTHGSKFDLLMKNGVVYMSLEFNLGLKTTKNEYIKAF